MLSPTKTRSLTRTPHPGATPSRASFRRQATNVNDHLRTSGYAAVESYKPYLKPHVLMYKPYLLGGDPTLVERVMLNIRHRGAFKPWRYNGAVRFPMTGFSAIRFARAVEPLNITWLEDMITGDYTPYVDADVYKDVTQSTSTPIHTGDQIYLRQNFKSLIEGHAVNVLGPDPCDVGGIAELKWIAEYADLHGILMAPHGTGDGLFGLAALVQVCATLPQNFIAFEYPVGRPTWWHDIVEGLPEPIVDRGFIDVDAWTRPGIGLDFNVEAAKAHLREEDADFFD